MPIRWKENEARASVLECYHRLFGRAPETNVLQGVVSYLVAGDISMRMEFTRMVKSEEFFDKRLRDRSPEDAASILYQAVLGRVPGSEEVKNAVDFINGVGWQTQVDVMLNSEEFLGKFGDDKAPTGSLVVSQPANAPGPALKGNAPGPAVKGKAPGPVVKGLQGRH